MLGAPDAPEGAVRGREEVRQRPIAIVCRLPGTLAWTRLVVAPNARTDQGLRLFNLRANPGATGKGLAAG